MLSNASLFRRYAKVEDEMMRAAMPRVNELDPPMSMSARARAVVASRLDGVRLVKPLTFTIAEAVQS
jgi:hypothetical protein